METNRMNDTTDSDSQLTEDTQSEPLRQFSTDENRRKEVKYFVGRGGSGNFVKYPRVRPSDSSAQSESSQCSSLAVKLQQSRDSMDSLNRSSVDEGASDLQQSHMSKLRGKIKSALSK